MSFVVSVACPSDRSKKRFKKNELFPYDEWTENLKSLKVFIFTKGTLNIRPVGQFHI